MWRVPVITWIIGQDGLPLNLLVHAGEQKDVEFAVPESKVVELFSGGKELEVTEDTGPSSSASVSLSAAALSASSP